MPKPKTTLILNPKPQSQITLSEYVTAIAWSPNSKYLAAATASGETVLFEDAKAGNDLTQKLIELQAPTEISVDCLGFSADGRWLAAGGQDGKVRVWKLDGDQTVIAETLDLGTKWIEHLIWHPTRPEFAFSFGKYVQIWSAETLDIVTTLHFEQSTVL
ncbi:MAG: WD40 repeat domain-containing protein, partial [Pseudanabaena sp.]